MSYSEKQVLDALRQVEHPDKKKNIVDLKMINDIEITGNKIQFSLIFDKSNDPFIKSLRQACIKSIKENLGQEAEIEGNINVVARQKVESQEEETQESQKQKSQKKKGKGIEPISLPGVKNIIGVASSKGGVGKSMVASNLAVSLAQTGARVSLVDADVHGPNLPKMFDVEDAQPEATQSGDKTKILPLEKYGVKLLSIGFFIDPEKPLIWRGPMISNAMKQLFTEAEWGEADYLILDLPPGTGDIHITMVQSLAVTGAVIVTTPQEVAVMDAIKGISMFQQEKINVPVLGIIENMSYFTPDELPDKKYYLFGKEGGRKLADNRNIPLLGEIPVAEQIMQDGEQGKPSALDSDSRVGSVFKGIAENTIKQLEIRNATQEPTEAVKIDPNAGVKIDPNAEGCSYS